MAEVQVPAPSEPVQAPNPQNLVTESCTLSNKTFNCVDGYSSLVTISNGVDVTFVNCAFILGACTSYYSVGEGCTLRTLSCTFISVGAATVYTLFQGSELDACSIKDTYLIQGDIEIADMPVHVKLIAPTFVGKDSVIKDMYRHTISHPKFDGVDSVMKMTEVSDLKSVLDRSDTTSKLSLLLTLNDARFDMGEVKSVPLCNTTLTIKGSTVPMATQKSGLLTLSENTTYLSDCNEPLRLKDGKVLYCTLQEDFVVSKLVSVLQTNANLVCKKLTLSNITMVSGSLTLRDSELEIEGVVFKSFPVRLRSCKVVIRKCMFEDGANLSTIDSSVTMEQCTFLSACLIMKGCEVQLTKVVCESDPPLLLECTGTNDSQEV